MPHQPQPIYVVKAAFFRALGHPARVRILELLREGEHSVGQLQAELTLDSSGTSQHLAALRRAGLVTGRRQGTSVFYQVQDERVFDLLDTSRSLVAATLAQNQDLLNDLGGR
jgi:ArsR family transcriptional regulator